MKQCSSCLEEKPLSEFGSNGNGYYKSKCKPCYNKAHKVYRESNKEKIQDQWRAASRKMYSTESRRNKTLKTYGMTAEDYEAMFIAQEGRCKICQREMKLVVDHCHTTGAVRGLLCDRCNVGLGCFEDDLDRLRAALLYLTPSTS